MDTSIGLFEIAIGVVGFMTGAVADYWEERRKTRGKIQVELALYEEKLKNEERERQINAQKEVEGQRETRAYELRLLRKLVTRDIECQSCDEDGLLFYERMIEMGWVVKQTKVVIKRHGRKDRDHYEEEVKKMTYELTPLGRINALCPQESDREIVLALHGEVES